MDAVEMEYLSYSRLSLYQECPFEFYMKYIQHAPPENPTTEYYAEYGSLIHAILENQSKAHGFITQPKLIDMFYNGCPTRDGMVKGFNEIYFPPWRNNAMAQQYEQQGIDFIGKMGTREYMNIVGVEQEFLFKVADDVPPIKGYIDNVSRINGRLVVTDYKSSKVYDQHKCDTSKQMDIYGLACMELYQEYPAYYMYEFPRFNAKVKTYRTPEQLAATKQWIIDTWYEITTRTDWPITCDSFFRRSFCEHRLSAQRKQEGLV